MRGTTSPSLLIYVSTTGNDTWSGTLPDPNRDRTDGPFATLERARDAVRSMRLSGMLTHGAVVSIRGGIYERRNPLVLTRLDSGVPSAPVIWRSHPGEVARIIGGKRIKNFRPVSDPIILKRLDILKRNDIVRCELWQQGIRNYGSLTPRGFGRPLYPAAMEVFFNSRPMELARFPNTGWMSIAGVPQQSAGYSASESGSGRPVSFRYDGDRPRRWQDLRDIWVHGYWARDWADSYERVESIDTVSRTVRTCEPHGVYGYKEKQRFRFLNVLEELDEPGEWYLDRRTGTLYLYPPSPPSGAEVCVSMMEEPLVFADGASHITLRGLVFEITRGNGIDIAGGNDILVAGCTIRNIGNIGAIIRGGSRNGMLSCDIHDTGDGGIVMEGGDRATLTPAQHFARNNNIGDYSRWVRTYRPAVKISGVGNRAANNLIHDAPHMGILLSGNDHTVEYNVFRDICRDTGDVGACYIGRDWTMRGNVIRFNIFKNINGPGAGGARAVYLDDLASGTTVYGNSFRAVTYGVIIGGGRDNTVENNVFASCDRPVQVDGRGIGWAKANAAPGGSWRMYERLASVPYDRSPYRSRYRGLSTILRDDPALPKGNVIRRNIAADKNWLAFNDGVDSLGIVTVRDNIVTGDPGFGNPGAGDFRLLGKSRAAASGFKPIPYERIGLYVDEYRSKAPRELP